MLRPDIDPTEWSHRAVCRGLDSDLFFFESHANPAVKATCESCPVRLQCGIYAIEADEHGFWGGMTRRERNKRNVADLYRELDDQLSTTEALETT